jgi:hypothetical protein
VKLRLRCLDEQAKFWGPSVTIGNGLLRCPLHYWHVVTGIPNQACYSLINICNEL